MLHSVRLEAAGKGEEGESEFEKRQAIYIYFFSANKIFFIRLCMKIDSFVYFNKEGGV